MRKPQYPLGTVTEALGAGRFRVLMDEDKNNAVLFGETESKEIIAYLAGRMRQKNINVMPGDKVEVVLDPAHGKATNRIVWRYAG